MERLLIADVALKKASESVEFFLSFREKIKIAKLLDKVMKW